jgi:hypothetical protein
MLSHLPSFGDVPAKGLHFGDSLKWCNMYPCTVIIALIIVGDLYIKRLPRRNGKSGEICCVSKEMNVLGKTPHGVGIMGTTLWKRI